MDTVFGSEKGVEMDVITLAEIKRSGFAAKVQLAQVSASNALSQFLAPDADAGGLDVRLIRPSQP